jgi:hypothetical protein
MIQARPSPDHLPSIQSSGRTARLLAFVVLLLPLSAASAQEADDPNDPVLNFEHVWATLDRTYAGFESRQVDWDALHRIYRPQVTAETTDEELFDVLIAMIRHLNDAHVCINDGARRVCSGFIEELTMDDFSRQLVRSKYLQGDATVDPSGRFTYGWLAEGVGYVHIHDFKLSAAAATEAIDAVIATFAEADAMVVDVRGNTGGSAPATRAVANRFADRPRHFMTTWTRYGASHDDFAPPAYHNVEPEGPAQFTKPTILLAHRFSESAADTFDLALRVLPQVTVVGEITGGALGTLYEEPLPNGWQLVVSFKTMRDHNGVCWDGIGVPPDLRMINTKADIDAGTDRVLEFAVDLLLAGALVSQEDAKSLETIRSSMVYAFERDAQEHGLEAALATLEQRHASSSEEYYFAVDEVYQLAARYLGQGRFEEIVGIIEFSLELFPQGAGMYGMLAFALLNLDDEESARRVVLDAREHEPMFSWERPLLERAKAELGEE